MTKEERLTRLKEHQDTLQVEYAGEERYWLLGRYALHLVKQAGEDPDEILGSVGGDGMTEDMDMFAKILWAGFLPFDEDLEYEEVQMLLSMGDMARLSPKIMGPFLDLQDGAMGKAMEEAKKRQG